MSKPIPTKLVPTWVDVPYLETTDRVLGGLSGDANSCFGASTWTNSFIGAMPPSH